MRKAHLGWRWQILDLFVKYLLQALGHGADGVVWPIEEQTVLEDQAHIGDEFFSVEITRIFGVGVWFGRV